MAYAPLKDVPLTGAEPMTDYTRWRLDVLDDGRHIWRYLHSDEECKARPQTVLDKYWIGLPLVRVLFRVGVALCLTSTRRV